MQYLRYATAVIVSVGPFLDKGDGVTLETGLTITNERITLVAETDDNSAPTNVLDNVTGATSGTSNDLNYITGNDAAMMQLELSAANTTRLGRMRLIITDAANHCPVFHEYTVIPAAIYDAMFSAGASFGDVAVNTTIATLASQTSFTLTDGSADNTAYGVGAMVVVRDATTKTQLARGILSAYTGSTKTVTLAADPGIFTMAVGDTVQIILQPTQIGTASATAGSLLTAGTGTNQLSVTSGAANAAVTSMGNNVMTAAAAASDLTTELQSGLATASALSTVAGYLDTEVAAILADTTTLLSRLSSARAGYLDFLNGTVAGRLKKNTAFTNFMIKMENTDGTPGTGLTVTVQRAIDGGAFAALAVTTVTEISGGWYKFNFAASDINGDVIAVKATATGAKQRDFTIVTQVAS